MKGFRWFRWHRGTSENPKFALIAALANQPSGVGNEDRVRGAVSLTDVLGVWCVILEDAANELHWGTCCKDAKFIAIVLRWWPEEVQQVLNAMVEHELLEQADDGSLKVAKWAEYQYASDSDPTAAERQRRYYHSRKASTSRKPHASAIRPETETEKKKEEGSRPVDNSLGASRRSARQANGAQYADPAIRKQRWEQKVSTFLIETKGADEAMRIIDAYGHGEHWAKKVFDEADRDRKAATV